MAFANPWDNPDFFQRFVIGGRPVLANCVEIDGNKVEDMWDVQKPTGSSGATNVFKGTNPVGPCKLVFECVSVEEWDDLRIHYENLAPKPGIGQGGTGNTTGSPGSAAYGKAYTTGSSAGAGVLGVSAPSITAGASGSSGGDAASSLAQAQAALAALQSGVLSPSAAAPATASKSTAAAAGANPGPKPPTLSIENGYLAYHGFTSCSRKIWDGPRPSPTNGMRVTIELVLQKAPVKAGVGAAATQSSGAQWMQSKEGPQIEATGPAKSSAAFNKACAAAGAGT